MLKFYHTNFLNKFITTYLSLGITVKWLVLLPHSSEFKSPAIAAETELSSMTLTQGWAII